MAALGVRSALTRAHWQIKPIESWLVTWQAPRQESNSNPLINIDRPANLDRYPDHRCISCGVWSSVHWLTTTEWIPEFEVLSKIWLLWIAELWEVRVQHSEQNGYSTGVEHPVSCSICLWARASGVQRRHEPGRRRAVNAPASTCVWSYNRP